MPKTKTAPRDRIAELEDKLKQRDARIRELRAKLNKADTLVVEMREQVEDLATQHIESWIEGYEMTLNTNNESERNRSFIEGDEWFEKYQEVLLRKWNRSFIEGDEWFEKYQEVLLRKWNRSFIEGDEWFEKYQMLLRNWNRFVPEWNALVRPRNVGRPLAASEAQVAEVLKLHKAGGSLRGIADATSLGLATVRTIIGQKNGTDRTTVKHLKLVKAAKGPK